MGDPEFDRIHFFWTIWIDFANNQGVGYAGQDYLEIVLATR